MPLSWAGIYDSRKLLHAIAMPKVLVADKISPTGVALLNGESSDKKAEPEEDMLRLTTIHQSKGLEFPIVFLLGVADGLLPLTRAIDEGDVEEERRLFYVACTRAENMLFLFAPRFAVSGEGYRPLDPCRFLEEMSPDCYELADYAHRRL